MHNSGASRREIAKLRLKKKLRLKRLRLKLFWLFESFGPSCPDLIRASIHLRNKSFSKMDHRVKCLAWRHHRRVFGDITDTS